MAIGELVERIANVFRRDLDDASNPSEDGEWEFLGTSFTPTAETLESFRTDRESLRDLMASSFQVPESFLEPQPCPVDYNRQHHTYNNQCWLRRQRGHEFNRRYERLAEEAGINVTPQTLFHEAEENYSRGVNVCRTEQLDRHVEPDEYIETQTDYIEFNHRVNLPDRSTLWFGYSEPLNIIAYKVVPAGIHYYSRYDLDPWGYNWSHERYRELQEQFRERRNLREETRQKAKTLLKECLTPEQLGQFEESETFTVTSNTGREYTITNARAYNVERGSLKFCAEPLGRMPVYDKMLAQKMLIETDEKAFLDVANVGDGLPF